MFLKIGLVMFPLLALVGTGFLYARRVQPDFSGVNRLCVDVCLPALIFSSLSSKHVDLAAQVPFLGAATVIVLLCGALVWPLSRWAGVSPRAFVPTLAIGNLGPVGLPVTLLALGPDALTPALLLLVWVNAIHFTLGVGIMSGKPDFISMLKSPLLWATLLGVLFSAQRWALPEALALPIQMVSSILIPMMLISMGARFIHVPWRAWRVGLIGGALGPAARIAIAIACVSLLPLAPEQRGALYVFAALPSAIINFLLADRFKIEAENVAAIVLIGHLLSLVFLPIAVYLSLA